MRAALGFILATITLDILAMTMVIPVLPPLIQGFMGGSAAGAAHVVGIFATAWALMQFIFSPVQGALSDHFGRRPVILASNLGLGLDYLLMAMAPDVRWLFVGRVISGITAASVSCTYAYISDITPPERRAARFGLISVAWGLGLVTGPAIGGLLGSVSPRLPFYVAGALSLLNFVYGALILPESLAPENRAPWRWMKASPWAGLYLLWSRRGLRSLGAVNFLMLVAHNILPTLFVLYVTNRYGFSLHQVGLTLGVMGIAGAFVGGVLTGRVVRWLGERATLLLGIVLRAAAMVLMGLAPNGMLFLAAIPILALGDLGYPPMTALMTRQVGPDEQGRLQGATSSLQGVSGLIAPAIFTESFAAFAVAGHGIYVPGMPFLISAGLLFTAWALALRTAPSRTNP